MMCAWQNLLRVLPGWLATEMDRPGRSSICELRLRLDLEPELNYGAKWECLNRKISEEDLSFVINTASRYSPWAASSLGSGYLTVSGGHRIGVCGEVIRKNDRPSGFRTVTGLCIRICRDFPGIGKGTVNRTGSVLILGPPGSGKTTLLRDILRLTAETETVSVIDERSEIFPDGFCRGKRMDVLTGCGKPEGIDMVLRTMGPAVIGVDEITSEGDCDALIRAGWCGVRLVATAHAGSVSDLYKRPVYRKLSSCGLFDRVLVMRRDRSWCEERMGV